MKRFAMIALVGLSVLAAPMAVSTPVAAKGLSKAWWLALGAMGPLGALSLVPAFSHVSSGR